MFGAVMLKQIGRWDRQLLRPLGDCPAITVTSAVVRRKLASAFHVFTPSGLGVSTKVAIL
jgi:hypothetical protein